MSPEVDHLKDKETCATPFQSRVVVVVFQLHRTGEELASPHIEFDGRYDDGYSLAFSLGCHRHQSSGALTKVDPAKANLDSAQCSGNTSTHSRKKQHWTPWLVKGGKCWHYARKLDFSLRMATFK